MKQKWVGWILVGVLALGISSTALAEEVVQSRRMMTLSGTVVAGQTKAVLAPFGGMVRDVALRAGDMVSAGDVLLELDTTKVYAPCDGTVGSVGTQVGDSAAFIQERYGALLYIEPKSQFLIETDTKYAYNAGDNYLVHVGETVYVGSRNSAERAGIGFVSKVDGSAYTVEVTEGNLIMGDGVSIFRASDFVASSKIGSGTITAAANVAVTAEGSVFALHVRQGDTVRRGDLLAEVVSGDLLYNPTPTNKVVSGYTGIIASVDVSAGSTASEGATLLTIHPTDSLQVAVQVSEADLRNIAIGDSVRIELASAPGGEPLPGTVASISGLSASGDEATEAAYTVYIGFAATEAIRAGMSANVYVNE